MGVGSVIKKLFSAPEQKGSDASLADPSTWLLELFGALPAISGVVVTPQTAMHCMPVRAAVQAIAEALGQLPLHLYSQSSDGTRKRDTAHPIAPLLNRSANDWTPSNELREQVTRDACLWGHGYAWIGRAEGRVVEMVRLDPSSVSLTVDLSNGQPTYRGTGQSPTFDIIPARDMVHIRAPGAVHWGIGESPIIQAKEAIGLSLIMEGHAARLFGRGARPSGVITIPPEVKDPKAVAAIKAIWTTTHAGTNSGDTAVLSSGATWNPLSLNAVDSQFLELRKFAIEEIARAFRVPPVLLMEFGRATWGNSEEMGRQFASYCLLPWVRRWEGELQLKLLDASTYAEFNLDGLLRADLAQRATAYAQLIAARILNPNEVRELENRPPYAGGDAFLNPNTIAEQVSL